MKTLFAGITAIIIIIGGLFIGADFALTKTMDISLIGTIANVAMLTAEPDKDHLCDHPFDKEKDMVDVQETVNASVENMITYSKEYGYNVNFDNLPDDMKNIIVLTDKQVGALAETVIEQESQGQIHVSGNLYMDVELYQVKFEKGEGEDETIVNTVIGIDATAYKSTMNLPDMLNDVAALVPDVFYIKSTFLVTKDKDAFTYSIDHISLEMNNLQANQSEDTFHVLNVVTGLMGVNGDGTGIGDCEHINLQIADAVMDALVGSEDTRGLAYSLREIGAKDFNFIEQDGNWCFAVER